MTRLFLLFTIVPVLELALLIRLGGALGVVPTILLVIGTGVLGAALARSQGTRALRRLHEDLAAGKTPGPAILDGALVLVAAVLLVTPGVLTDVAALLLLVPPVRAAAGRALVAWGAKHVVVVGPQGRAQDGVIDVEARARDVTPPRAEDAGAPDHEPARRLQG